MQVLCVGLCRSATESLQHALLTLGYDHTYHGWNMVFDQPSHIQEWNQLARKKLYPEAGGDGDCHISAEEFDAVMGHAVAVCDVPASLFASELVEAYPEAKVILNKRTDLEKWRQSAIQSIVGTNEKFSWWLMTWWSVGFFWVWHVCHRLMLPNLFRCPDGTLDSGIRRNGKWVYREHCNMIRGLVPADRLLEWSVEDGWEPLCKFLGKEVPKEDFPRVNDAAGFRQREIDCLTMWTRQIVVNVSKTALIGAVSGILIVSWRRGTLGSLVVEGMTRFKRLL